MDKLQFACSTLVGTPYEKLDCFGVARKFYSWVMGVELKHYYDGEAKERDEAKSLIYSNMGDFEQVTEPKLGDLILMKMYGVESHIGVYIGSGAMLHTQKTTGCVVAPISRYSKVIVGYYRVKKVTND